jgi:hypothetical protein
MKTIKVLVATLLAAVLFADCSSSTMIRSTDPDAKIYIDGELMGKGSIAYSDTKTILTSTVVRMEKPGCAPVTNIMSRSEFDVGACIGGVFLIVPFLWIEKYKPEFNYEYTCSSSK